MNFGVERAKLPRRLDKFVRDSTGLSLSAVRGLISSGQVDVQIPAECKAAWGVDLRVCNERIVYQADRVLLDGQLLAVRSQFRAFLLNKPKGVTSTLADPKGRGDLQPFTAQMPFGMKPVGRLDRETTGALLFTDDGDLANGLLRSEFAVRKVYRLLVDCSAREASSLLPRFEAGVRLGTGEWAQAESAVLKQEGSGVCVLELVLTSGLNRQIRRMCSQLSVPLIHLHRVKFAGLSVGENLASIVELQASQMDGLWQLLDPAAVYRRRWLALEMEADKQRASGQALVRLEAWLQNHPLPVEESRRSIPGASAGECLEKSTS